jgi:hypothetical protein
MYLWGSAGITQNQTFDKPLVLHIRNNVFGEEVTVGTAVSGVANPAFGNLQPGESFSIPIQNISGVFATCALETNVDCIIQPAP